MMPGGEQQFPGTQRPSPPGFVWQGLGLQGGMWLDCPRRKQGLGGWGMSLQVGEIRDLKGSPKTGEGVSSCGCRVTLWAGMTTLERNGPLAP